MFVQLLYTDWRVFMDDHTVRISSDNLDKLKSYKDRWSLSYNDIIGMALNVLDGAKMSDVAVEAPVYRIKVSLNRVRINENVKSLLKNGYDLFIPDITHRQAMYVKRKLKSMGFETEYIKSEGDGKNGFLFTQHSEPQPRKVQPEPVSEPLTQPISIPSKVKL